MIRAVIDTNVYISAFVGAPGSTPSRVLDAHSSGRFEIVTSERLIAELSRALRHKKLIRQSADGRGGEFVDEVARIALFADDSDDPPESTRDRDDDYVVAVAVNGGADYIVSGDRDLTEAIDPPVAVVTPAEFLAELDRRDA